MLRKNRIVTLVAGLASLAFPAFSQSEEVGKNEVSVQAFGSFLKTTTDDGVQNSATNSGGVLGSYRYFFSQHQGVEVDYGYALNTQNFASSSGALGVKNYSHEVSAAYVFRLPLKRVHAFRDGGRRSPGVRSQGFSGCRFADSCCFRLRRRGRFQHLASRIHAGRVSRLRLQLAHV